MCQRACLCAIAGYEVALFHCCKNRTFLDHCCFQMESSCFIHGGPEVLLLPWLALSALSSRSQYSLLFHLLQILGLFLHSQPATWDPSILKYLSIFSFPLLIVSILLCFFPPCGCFLVELKIITWVKGYFWKTSLDKRLSWIRYYSEWGFMDVTLSAGAVH